MYENKTQTEPGRDGGGGLGVILFIDWHGWWGLTPHFGRRASQHAEVAHARVPGGDDTLVLHRYSARGVTLSCPVKVRACSSEGAETGSSRMMLAPAPDVTAQLGRLMTEGPRPGAHLPILDGPGDLTGRERGSLPRWMDRCSGEETAALQGPLRLSSLSSNWKSCKRSIVWYWLSLSECCSCQPEHGNNNTDWMTAFVVITTYLTVHVMTKSVNILSKCISLDRGPGHLGLWIRVFVRNLISGYITQTLLWHLDSKLEICWKEERMDDALTFALKDTILESGLGSEPVSDEIWQGWNYQRTALRLYPN